MSHTDRPDLPDDPAAEDGRLTTPSSERDAPDDGGGADSPPASGAAGGSGPPGVGEGNAGVGVETEGMPDPPELQDEEG